MIRKFLVSALILATLAVVPLSADLRFTMHMDVKKTEGGGAVNPMMAMVSQQFAKMIPPGGADMIYLIGDEGVRIEYVQAAMGQPAGAVTISRKTGEMFALQPADKTYWKIQMQDAAAMMSQAGIVPKVSVKPTGEFTEVQGIRAERVSFEWTMDLPIPDEARASLPADFPTSLSMTGDNWVAAEEKYKKYGALIAGNKAVDFLAAMGLDKLAASGLTLKSIVRFAGMEMHGEVTKIGEVPSTPGYLDIPEGFKEIPMPQPAIR